MKTINFKGRVPIRYVNWNLKRCFSRLMPALLFCLMTGQAFALDISDYTAYPPFLPRMVSPNILFMLDYSKSMVKPAYGACTSVTGISDCRYTFSNLLYDYDSAQDYSGYFDTTSGSDKYTCSGGSNCVKDAAGVWKGNFLNWLTISQYDIMKKVTVGGDIDPAPEQGNPTKMRSILTTGYTYRKTIDLPGSGNVSSCSSTDSPNCIQWPTITYNWLTCSGSCSATNLFTSSVATTSYDNYASAAQTLPFPFTFYGTTYTQLYISTNGLLSFDSTLASNTSLLGDDVESGTGSWTATGLWHREASSSCATPHSGSAMWYYGQNSTCDYDNGATNSGTLQSASMTLPAGKTAQLSFWYATETEGGSYWDARYVQVSTNGGTTWTNLAQIIDSDDPLVWREKVIDLTSYAGQTIKLRFSFDTKDAYANWFQGWFIDDINVSSSVASSASLDNTNLDLPNSASPNALIAPYWDDLIVQGKSGGGGWTSSVSTFTSGSAPNRIFVITYTNVRNVSDTAASTNLLTFQVLLYEGSNHIVFQYNDVKATTSNGGGKSATIGVENNNGTGAKKFSYCTSCASAALSNSLAIFATPHVSYTITPSGGTANVTKFQPAPPLTTTSNDYNINININSVAKVSGSCPAGSYYNRDRDSCYDHPTLGLLQDFRDGELGGTLGFRLAIMQLNDTDGGTVVKHFNEKDTTAWASLMAATRGQTPTLNTPLAESLQIAEGYFKQDTTFNMGLTSAKSWTNDGTGSTCGTTGNQYDPFCFQSAAQRVSCCKSFVLLVSSGNYSNDNRTNIYGDAADANGQLIAGAWQSTGEPSGSEGTMAYGGWLDNVAYKAHTTDWRPEMDGNQNLTIYTVNTFGTGSGDGTNILKRAAKYGGFEDLNGNNAYDAGEDDRNGDGDPDTYFEASGGSNLKDQIVAAVAEIMKSSASGTSVSVLSTSAGGEGAIYQAYFYPAKAEGATDERTWPGYLRAFFLDNKQNLRDDFSGGATPDAKQVMANDRIVKMTLNTTTNAVDVNLYTDADGVEPFTAAGTTTMDDIISIWEGGKKLALRDKSTRHIYTWLDTGGTSTSTTASGFSSIGGTAKDFTTSEASSLKSYLRAQAGDVDGAGPLSPFTANKEAEYIIRFTRGEAITPDTTSADGTGANYRNRCISISGATAENGCSGTQRVWGLGDIVYSTPTLVSAPGEKYDSIYGDATYKSFTNKYLNRRSVVYVGANDGLLHAFNAGVFTGGDDPATTSVVETGQFAANPSSGNGWTSPTPGLGDELWGFVPYDDLPHLAWLACNGTSTAPTACGASQYTHVFYVDQRPKATDVRIFNNTDSTACPGGASGLTDGQSGACHPGGWGTILIVPLRLGGGAMDVTADFGSGSVTKSFRSAFYVFDITDPEKPPKLLWRFTDPGLGFTTSYPAIAKIGAIPSEKWYMVFGSGPNNNIGTQTVSIRDYAGTSTTLSGKVYVLDVSNGSLKQTLTVDANTFMGDPAVVDENLDFVSDTIYIGSAISTTQGKVYRIQTGNTQPATTPWVISTLFNTGRPDLVAPSVAKDAKANLWVFFGTGRLRGTADLSNVDQQTFYGIKDACGKAGATCTTTYITTDLLNSSNFAVCSSGAGTNAGQVYNSTTGTCGTGTSTYSNYAALQAAENAKQGWYVNLTVPASPLPSERALSRSAVLGGLVLFTTYTPASDMCSVFGDSNLYSLYYETGTAYIKPTVGTTGSGTTETVNKSISLGKGMPTAVGVAIGETMTGFVQKSTGEIVRVEAQPGLSVRSGAAAWREKTGGSGTSEIEMIYKHIVK